MNEEDKEYGVVRLGYDSYVMPFDEAVAFLRTMRKAEKVRNNSLDGKYVEMIYDGNDDITQTLTIITYTQLVAMRMMGERFIKEKAAQLNT